MINSPGQDLLLLKKYFDDSANNKPFLGYELSKIKGQVSFVCKKI